jgi:hypothetical protein
MRTRVRGRTLRGASGVLVALGATALPLVATGEVCSCCTAGPGGGSATGLYLLLTALPFVLFAASAVLLRLSGPRGASPPGEGDPSPATPLSIPANAPTR